jgi:hypothetical protein
LSDDAQSSTLPALSEEGLPAPLSAHADEHARIYARLLVSDIRLYHEEQVIHGRLVGDLSRRLAGPIASAREAYLRRFADVHAFERELVRILAGGDRDKLGAPNP